MFGKKKDLNPIDKDQLELLKNAQNRINQKKRLYRHFVIFLIGSVFFILFNLVFDFGKDIALFGWDWFVYAILLWLFLLIYHVFHVFVTHKFMGKDWEDRQLNKLIEKQKDRIETLKRDLEKKANSTINSNSSEEKKKAELTIIVAAANNDAIGKDNKLIWHLSDDLKRFKSLTNGHHVIMGRKTFESFPKPLPNRTHIVITRQTNYQVPGGVIIVNNLEAAIDAAKNDAQPFIIGGGEIYKQAFKFANKIELTRVHETFEADTFFPKIDASIWKETNRIFHAKNEKNDYDFTFLTYIKK